MSSRLQYSMAQRHQPDLRPTHSTSTGATPTDDVLQAIRSVAEGGSATSHTTPTLLTAIRLLSLALRDAIEGGTDGMQPDEWLRATATIYHHTLHRPYGSTRAQLDEVERLDKGGRRC